jgi:CheY-like chemotaxis protein
MGGEIWLDDSYDSGVPGHPGSRFIVNLKQKPIQFDPDSNSCLHVADSPERYVSNRSMDDSTPLSSLELPEKLSVLFIDDDPILRKLFIRTVQKVAPGWWIQEASSGEAALRLLEMENFDVIFCDMYMASVEKSLLGSETVEMMRRNGVTSRICGLSANDKENEFLAAGADCFLFKPFPCERHALEKELFRILNLPQHPEE